MSQIKSPNYPSKSLADAIDAVAKIEAQYRSSAASREDAAKLLGYSSLSGPSTKTLGALASYGLTERAGTGMIRVTPLARAILHPSSNQEKVNATVKAGLTPSLFREIKEHFEDIPVPPEQGVVTYLNRAGFNPSAVPKAAKAFLNTAELLEQLEATSSSEVKADTGNESSSPKADSVSVSVGDFVQWESLCVPQFERPMRVRWISEDGAFLAVDDSETSIPVDQVIVESAPQNVTEPKQTAPRPPPPQSPPPQTSPLDGTQQRQEPSKEGVRKAVFPVSEGDVTFIFPEGMTLDGIEELEDYLAVFLKKEKRNAQAS